jgi:hypothetical protein
MTPEEAEMREEIGLRNMMWGADFPHVEGTWPHSRVWLSRALRDVPEDHRRLILGENAARAYRIDVGKLESDVERIGLRPEDLTREDAERWSDLVYGVPPEKEGSGG